MFLLRPNDQFTWLNIFPNLIPHFITINARLHYFTFSPSPPPAPFGGLACADIRQICPSSSSSSAGQARYYNDVGDYSGGMKMKMTKLSVWMSLISKSLARGGRSLTCRHPKRGRLVFTHLGKDRSSWGRWGEYLKWLCVDEFAGSEQVIWSV